MIGQQMILVCTTLFVGLVRPGGGEVAVFGMQEGVSEVFAGNEYLARFLTKYGFQMVASDDRRDYLSSRPPSEHVMKTQLIPSSAASVKRISWSSVGLQVVEIQAYWV